MFDSVRKQLTTGIWLLMLLAGCAGEPAVEFSPVVIQPPEVFESDAVKWRREDRLGDSDTRLLSRYFQQNPSLIDSPAFTGVPILFHGTKHRRRFYWIKETAGKPTWVCVQYARGRFHFLEGNGNPYSMAADEPIGANP